MVNEFGDGRRGTSQQAPNVARRTRCCRRPSCARSASRSCSRPGSAICDLRPEGTLAECVEQVIGELRDKGITFVPAYYLGDDDFWTADRAVSVNVPWYLANPRLWGLVNDHLFEYTREEVLMYLRHEAGHAINYAFELWRRRDWTQTFGDFRRPYRDVYNPNPWSRDYVRYLHRAGMYHYAQKHPDEDWAETFAVWLEGGTLAAPLPRLAGGAAPSSSTSTAWSPSSAPAAATPTTCASGCASRTRRSRRRSPSTSTSATRSTRTCSSTARTCIEIFGRRPPRARAIAMRGLTSRTANAQSAARFIQQHQTILVDRISRWIGDSDKRVILRLPASAAGALHRRAHGRPRQPPHREARRADRRRDLARRRRDPPTELGRAGR